ncbi:hypothetical protein MKX54_03940 [Alkalihalobacillus sp. FSL R5-0424]
MKKGNDFLDLTKRCDEMLNQNDDLLFTQEIKKLKEDMLYAIDETLKINIQKDISYLERVLNTETRNCISLPNAYLNC